MYTFKQPCAQSFLDLHEIYYAMLDMQILISIIIHATNTNRTQNLISLAARPSLIDYRRVGLDQLFLFLPIL